MGRTFLDIDMARAADLLGMERRQAEQFRDLQRGHFIGLGPALSRRPLAIRIGAVETQSRGSGPSLTPLPQTAPEEARELILAAPDPVAPRPARRPPPAPPQDILAQLAQASATARPAAARLAEPEPSPEELAEREARTRAILHDMLAESDAAFRPIGVLYQDLLVRLRIHAVPGKPPELPAFRRMLAVARAGVPPEAANDPDWPEAAARAEGLPEDTQGVFLLLAHAARQGLPCPSDAAIARAYGSRSAGRARRLLGWIEEQGLIVQKPAAGGRRVVALVGLAWETAPGDPAAA